MSTDGNATTHINIHVLSDLMVRSWYSTQGVDVDDAFASPASASNAAPSPSSVEILANAVIQPMRLWFGKARITITPGTPANSFINLISSSFSANGTGLDSALDSISSETLNSSTGVVSQVTVTGGTVTETITPDYSAGSMTLNTSTTDSSTGAVTTGSESTLLPASSAQQAAINSINSALSNFQSTVNAKGSALSGSDLLPYFASDYLNDGLNSSQDSAALAGDFAGLTMSGLQVTAIKSLDTTNNLADVILAITLSLGAQSETLIQEEIFKQESGSWLLYGDQRIASVTVTAESRASQGGSSISPGVAHQVDLSTEVMAPHGVVQSATVSGGGNIWNGTASGTLYDEAQILQNGIALDDFILLSQGLTSPFPAQGTQFTFNLTTVSSGNQQYQVPLSNGFTTETIEFSGISSTSGSGPLSSVVGKTLTYSWPLPTTYAATQVSFFAYIYDGPATTSTTHSCEIHYDSLSAAQTSGTITIPANMSACGLSASDAIQQVNLFLNITGADGENNITAIVYPY
ncbi:MAG TPA: hypothetical protein VE291_03870 [Terracidiphilus sp.]|nr:hypothetical protein [Terracidiphilus sp.]